MPDSIFTNPGIPRDRWDRPQIFPPPPRGKTHADVVEKYTSQNKTPPSYRRTTRFISVLEDRYELEMWSQRMVALGLGQRPDLVVSAASLTADREDKKALNNVAAQAKEHARSSSKATTGTALHKFCERLDMGQPVGSVPAPYDRDLEAYEAARNRYGLRYTAIEQMRVFDPWKVAGTPDRIVEFNGKRYICDIKTGNVDFDNTQREIAMQMAMYARSVGYTHERGREEDVPAVDQMRAIIIHLPAGQARCELHWVDLKTGWGACELAQRIWEHRATKGTFRPIEGFEPANHLEANSFRLTYAETAMQAATIEALREVWTAAAKSGALTDEVKAACEKRRAELTGATA